MNQPMNNSLAGFLEYPPLSRIRRNHALEHATLHVLSGRLPHTGLAGHSDIGGFWIVGEVPPEMLHAAVQEALTRLRAGESDLAVHPNCGTNYVTAGVLAGLSGAAAMLTAGKRWQDKLSHLPLAAALATIALVASQPLALSVQRHVTTASNPGTLEVVSISRKLQGRIVLNRVETRG
jgi:hypothetical protein